MDIAIDFDGTCVTHKYPKVGNDIGAAPVLKELVNNGHNLILFTMRPFGTGVKDAQDWFSRNNIPLFGIQKHPDQGLWTNSPKAQADLYIDDAGLGIPLRIDPNDNRLKCVDWVEVRKILVERKIIA